MAAALALLGLMGFYGAAHGETLKATAAGSALLRCDSALRGSPPAFLPPRLRWTRVGAAEEAPPLLLLAVGRGGGALGLGKGGALVLPRLRLSQSGPYVCQMGGAVSTTLVNVEGSKKLFLAAPIGSNVTLQCPVATPPAKATPTRKATPPARWFHWGHRIHRGAWPEGAELKLGPMGENHVGRYDCAIGERSGTVHVVLGEAQSLSAAPGASLEVPCRPPPPKKQPETARPTLLLLSPPPPPSQVTWFRGGYSGRTSGPPILKGWAAPGGGLGPMGALFLWGLRRSQSGRYRCEWAGLRGHAPNASHASDLSHAPGLSHARDLSPAHDLSHAHGLSPAPKGWDFPSPLPPLKGDPIFYGAGVWGDSNMGDFDGGGGGLEEEEEEEEKKAGGGSGGAEEVELEVMEPHGSFPAFWGRSELLGTFGVVYVAVGLAVAVGLWRRHRAQQMKARQQRLWDRRFLRVSDPGPHNSYGNVLCPTAHPSPPAELGSPIEERRRPLWGRDQKDGGGEEEEEEEGYEQPDSDSNTDGYENEGGAAPSQSSAGSYENDPNSTPASDGPPTPTDPTVLSPGAANLITGLQRALLAAQRWDGRSDGSAGSQPYEEMGGTKRAALRRDGTEDDAGSYENMAGAELTP